MTTAKIFIVIIIAFHKEAWSIWPPPYQVDLKHEEIFVVDEPLEKEEIQEVYNEEIINDNDIEQLKLDSIKSKFYGLHNTFKLQKENIYQSKFERKRRVYEESYPAHEDPFYAGYLDETGKSLLNGELRKRENDKENTDEAYEYKDLKQEFEVNLKKEEKSNESLIYTETTIESAPKGLMKSLISAEDNSTLNCTESRKLGLEYAQCLISDLGKPKLRSKVIDKVLRIFIIILIVYIVIALPLWCQYGWCCCCCRCRFCRPLEEIDEVKKFFVVNPVGVYHDKEGRKHEYSASLYEKYSQKKLSKALQSL